MCLLRRDDYIAPCRRGRSPKRVTVAVQHGQGAPQISTEDVITCVVAKCLWRQFFFGVRRRVAASQSGVKAPHSKKRLQVTAYAGVPSMRLDALCLWRTPPLAPLPACGEGTGVGSTQAAAPKKNVVGTHAQGCHRRDLGRQLPEDTETFFAFFACNCLRWGALHAS